MEWDAIGAVADLASALAVAVLLVYVAVQVRELKSHCHARASVPPEFLREVDAPPAVQAAKTASESTST